MHRLHRSYHAERCRPSRLPGHNRCHRFRRGLERMTLCGCLKLPRLKIAERRNHHRHHGQHQKHPFRHNLLLPFAQFEHPARIAGVILFLRTTFAQSFSDVWQNCGATSLSNRYYESDSLMNPHGACLRYHPNQIPELQEGCENLFAPSHD